MRRATWAILLLLPVVATHLEALQESHQAPADDTKLLGDASEFFQIEWWIPASEFDLRTLDHVVIANDSILVLAFGDTSIIALDSETGKRRWEAQYPYARVAAPVTTKTLLIIQTYHGQIVSLDINTGVEKWIKELPAGIR